MTTKCTSVKPGETTSVGREVFTITVADAADNGTSSGAAINGYIKNIVSDIADMTGVGTTATTALLDEDGTTLFSKASLAENTKTHTVCTEDEEFNFCGVMKVKITQSAAQSGAAATHYVIVYYSK